MARYQLPQVKHLGQHHPDVATTLAATAGLLKAMGRLADAETVYRLVGLAVHGSEVLT